MFFDKRSNYDDYYGPNTPGMEYSSAMSTASVILAFLSIFSSVMFYVAVPCGALSILFALLSRGRNKKVTGKCRIAILVSVFGITTSVVTTAVAVRTVMTNPEMRRQLEYMFNSYAQELGLDIEFDDYFGHGNEEDSEDGTSDDVPDDEERANEYFDKYYGNGDGLSDDGGALPDDGGALPRGDSSILPDDGNNTAPDMDDIFSYWYGFNGSEPGSGSHTTPSGGEYI